ncbi:hypothetical protein FQR65_LT10499 [Abscondita terminalis]|nr:hypothetical protein FQR65_LT10499 [Abscondita terminalis]
MIAGKSVSKKDLEVEEESSQEQQEKGADTSDEMNVLPNDDNVSPSVEIDENFQVGEFVIVKFSTNKRDRFFAARIEEILGKEATVKCLRKKSSKKEIIFAYPEIDDIVVVNFGDMFAKLNSDDDDAGAHTSCCVISQVFRNNPIGRDSHLSRRTSFVSFFKR